MTEDNPQGYTHDWQKYKGYDKFEYDKFEYDIKLHNEKVLMSCFPNAGKFKSLKDHQEAKESDVKEIRLSIEPITSINLLLT